VRGALPILLLVVLRSGPSYGYAITASLTQFGFGAVKGASIYPALSRLESAGWVATHWRPGDGGPGRKFFALTPNGIDALRHLELEWRQFTATVDRLIDENGEAE